MFFKKILEYLRLLLIFDQIKPFCVGVAAPHTILEYILPGKMFLRTVVGLKPQHISSIRSVFPCALSQASTLGAFYITPELR
jgi:hypothetical protein